MFAQYLATRASYGRPLTFPPYRRDGQYRTTENAEDTAKTEVELRIHQDILEVVNKRVLPDIIRVHEVEVPYPAELCVDGNCEHQDGTAMFSIGERGFLTAEYFAYDNTDGLLAETLGFRTVNAKLVMKGTRVEVPIWWLSNGHKARTRYSNAMPPVKVYECELKGWLGSSEDTPMQSASITLLDLPDLRLPRSRLGIPEENTHLEALTMRGLETKNAVLTLEAGGWKIQLTEGITDWQRKSEPLYHATLAREDGSPFTLSDEDLHNGILDALHKFLSFQCEAWVNISTIVCNSPFEITERSLSLNYDETDADLIETVRQLVGNSENAPWKAWDELGNVLRSSPGFEDVADASLSWFSMSDEYASMSFSRGNPFPERVWVNKLSPRSAPNRSDWIVSDWWKWPDLFREFWKQYSERESGNFLRTAVRHYVDCKRIADDGTISYAMVAAKSTLEVLTRWWNDRNERFQIKSGEFDCLLKTAVQNAELGKDGGRGVDTTQLTGVTKRATRYRNKIDHGQDSDIEGQVEKVYAHQSYSHILARLLILAKLGDRGTAWRGEFYTPSFAEK